MLWMEELRNTGKQWRNLPSTNNQHIHFHHQANTVKPLIVGTAGPDKLSGRKDVKNLCNKDMDDRVS